MEKIKQLVYNYAHAVHSQNEKEFKVLWSSKENMLISITDQFTGTDAIYQDFLIGGIQGLETQIVIKKKQSMEINAYSLFKIIGAIRNSYSSIFNL